VSGTAKGPDSVGEQWAIENGVEIHRFPADWKKNGKTLVLIRNAQMGRFADAAIIMWDGKSNGARHMRDVMKELDKPFLLDIIEPVHYNYEHMPNGTIEQFLGRRPAKVNMELIRTAHRA
jgi:hypothetical protein